MGILLFKEEGLFLGHYILVSSRESVFFVTIKKWYDATILAIHGSTVFYVKGSKKRDFNYFTPSIQNSV
jgi:hypothetical protein